MAVIHHPDWDLSERGKKDAERHHKKIDDAIRKNVRDVIGEESIITRKSGKTVRVPVKGMRDYRFLHGHPKKGSKSGDGNEDGEGQGQGAGQGPGKPGDIIDQRRKPADGQGRGKPGDKPGEDYIEAEVDIDYLIKIMFEDLGLPWIEEKVKANQLVPSGWKFDTITKKGILPRIHKKRTMLEAIKRNEAYAGEIMLATGCDHDDALRALQQSVGDINDAIKIINNDAVDLELDPYVLIEDEDMRYKQIEQAYELHSNAVVIAMMDISGSMGPEKKYLCRSLLFWMVEFLKKVYDFVDIKFIVHTTDAKIVDEHTFFHTGESGGTYCWSAIEKADYLVETEYPINEWNVYCVYVSDGEDFEPSKTLQYLEKLLSKKISMFSYNQVLPEDDPYSAYANPDQLLLEKIRSKWDFQEDEENGTSFYKNERLHLLLSTIKNRTHVYPTLKHILFKKDK